MRNHRDTDAEEWCRGLVSDELSVTGVVGMYDYCNARGQELRAGCVDFEWSRRSVEDEAVVFGRSRAILELCLSDGGLEVDVPHRWCIGRVGLPSSHVAQE